MVIKNQDTGKNFLNPENVSETMTCSRHALAPLGWALSRLVCPLPPPPNLALRISSASTHSTKLTQKEKHEMDRFCHDFHSAGFHLALGLWVWFKAMKYQEEGTASIRNTEKVTPRDQSETCITSSTLSRGLGSVQSALVKHVLAGLNSLHWNHHRDTPPCLQKSMANTHNGHRMSSSYDGASGGRN